MQEWPTRPEQSHRKACWQYNAASAHKLQRQLHSDLQSVMQQPGMDPAPSPTHPAQQNPGAAASQRLGQNGKKSVPNSYLITAARPCTLPGDSIPFWAERCTFASPQPVAAASQCMLKVVALKRLDGRAASEVDVIPSRWSANAGPKTLSSTAVTYAGR